MDKEMLFSISIGNWSTGLLSDRSSNEFNVDKIDKDVFIIYISAIC